MIGLKLFVDFLLLSVVLSLQNLQPSKLTIPLQQLSQKLAEVRNVSYNLQTSQKDHMDCLKIIEPSHEIQNGLPKLIGVFHQFQNSYGSLYYTQFDQSWQTVTKLSERGSQGTIFSLQINSQTAYIVGYQLENHQHGNTIAIRYYENLENLRKNFFTYEYQLSQSVDQRTVRNIGTPSIQSLSEVSSHKILQGIEIPTLKNYQMKIKFHYSPDGSHDFPGYGIVQIKPYRDFMRNGLWIGGCKQNYKNWTGYSDQKALNAIRSAGGLGKIGQRDSFQYDGGLYYLYESNIDTNFDWSKWRIFLYSQKENKAVRVPFNFDKVIDLANPHITKTSGRYILTFFVPSQAIVPATIALPGELYCQVDLN